MSKFKSKLARRIMAIVLSGAMVMSNMSVAGAGTVYAAESATEETAEAVETVEKTETETEKEAETEKASTVADNNEDADSGSTDSDKADTPQSEQSEMSQEDNKDNQDPGSTPETTVTVDTPKNLTAVEVKEEEQITSFKFTWEAPEVKVNDTASSDYSITYDVELTYEKDGTKTQVENLGTTQGLTTAEFSVGVDKLVQNKEYTYTFSVIAKASKDNEAAVSSTEAATKTITYGTVSDTPADKKLDPPTNLRIAEKTEGETTYVTFSWDSVTAPDSLSGYTISYDIKVTTAADKNTAVFTETGYSGTSIDVGKASSNFTIQENVQYIFSVTAKAAKDTESVSSAVAEKTYTFQKATQSETKKYELDLSNADLVKDHNPNKEKDTDYFPDGTLLGTNLYFKLKVDNNVTDPEDSSKKFTDAKAEYRYQSSKNVLDLTKWGSSGIEFSVKGTADVVIQASSTSSSNTSRIALVNAENNIQNAEITESETLKEESDGIIWLYKNNASTLKYNGLSEGTYTLLCPYVQPTDNNDVTTSKSNTRGARIYSIEVTETSDREARAAFSDITTKPAVEAAVDSKNTDEINVTVTNALVGYDGADKVTVVMTDEDGKEETEVSRVEGNSHKFTFTPPASTKESVKFKAVLSRSGETATITSDEITVPFSAPLKAPTNLKTEEIIDGDKVSVKFTWDKSEKADQYKVTVKEDGGSVLTDYDGVTVTEPEITISSGLIRGKTYVFTVTAVKLESAEGANDGDEAAEKKTYTISVPVEEGKEIKYTWNVSDADAKEYAENTKFGDNGFFALKATSSDKVTIAALSADATDDSGKTKTLDGITYTKKLSLGTGKADAKTVEFRADGAGKLIVYALSNGTDARTLGLCKESWSRNNATGTTGNAKPISEASPAKIEYDIKAAGTYNIGSTNSTINIYCIEFIQSGSSEAPGPEGPTDWNSVAVPTVTVEEYDDTYGKRTGTINVTVNAVLSDKDTEEVNLLVYDMTGKEITTSLKASKTEGNEHKFKYPPSYTSQYAFKAVLSRKVTSEDGKETILKKESEKTTPVIFTLPLAKPLLIDYSNTGTVEGSDPVSGSVELGWGAVSEATGYIVTAVELDNGQPVVDENGKEKEVFNSGTITSTSVTISKALEIGKTYAFHVAARRAYTGEGGKMETSDISTVHLEIKGTADTFESGKYILDAGLCTTEGTAGTIVKAGKYCADQNAVDIIAQSDGAPEGTGMNETLNLIKGFADSNYFTIMYGTGAKVSNDNNGGKGRPYPDNYMASKRIQLGSNSPEKGTVPTSAAIKFKTSGAARVDVFWRLSSSATRSLLLVDEKGSQLEKKTLTSNDQYVKATFFMEDAGTYYITEEGGEICIARLVVYDGYVKKERPQWTTEQGGVAAPAITDVALKTTTDKGITTVDDSTIVVKATADIGPEASADSVTVYMIYKNEDGSETIADYKSSVAAGTEHEFEFTPEASHKYYFSAKMARDTETTTIDSVDKDAEGNDIRKSIDFTLPLGSVSIKNVTNKGKADDNYGIIEASWSPVAEAIYEVEIKEGDATVYKKDETATTVTIGKRNANEENSGWADGVEGLKVGTKYTFSVTAKRLKAGTEDDWEKTETAVMEIEISGKNSVSWIFANFGSGASTKATTNQAGIGANMIDTDPDSPRKGQILAPSGIAHNGYEVFKRDENDNPTKVRVWSVGGKGKIVPASTDGVALYYTSVDPSRNNFTLSADVHVDQWTLSNGQDGFGVLAFDRVTSTDNETSEGDAFWNNSYMSIATKVQYRWDDVKQKVSNAGSRVELKLGIESIARTGVTTENLAEFENLNTVAAATNQYFKSAAKPLDTQVKDASYDNLIGNITNPESAGNTIENPITDLRMEIALNDTGYFVSYTPITVNQETREVTAVGEKITNKYYDRNALSQIDKEYVYPGLFASRNAMVTFSNIQFTMTPYDAATAQPEEKEIEYVAPSYSIVSAATSNSADYLLTYEANWNGNLVVKDETGDTVLEEKLTGSPDVTDKAEKLVTLNLGANTFQTTFTPDEAFDPYNGDPVTRLENYDAKVDIITVTYKKYGAEGQALYVSPRGSATGDGTEKNPLDIYTAVKYVQPGQTIYLMNGTYDLARTVRVERGTDGNKDAPIRMIPAKVDPDNRPVFDFHNMCEGMVLAGDWWYFYGFDVTRSSDGNDGIRVCGDYNTLDGINTYKNGNTGIQISRLLGSDTNIDTDWPKYNTIKNCTSYLNADGGYEDADGFACKLTSGVGNKFIGCVAAYNADDGWDFFAKVEHGNIGMVTIENCIAYKNGYVLRAGGETGPLAWWGEADNIVEVNAGNGNGFKMGGSSMSGYHTLRNSLAFYNKSKGFDSNSCSDIQVYDSITFNNESYNVAFYSYAATTDFAARGLISYRTEALQVDVTVKNEDGTETTEKQSLMKGMEDQIGRKESKNNNASNITITQGKTMSKIFNGSNYFWNAYIGKSELDTDFVQHYTTFDGKVEGKDSDRVPSFNEAHTVTDDWFESVDFDAWLNNLKEKSTKTRPCVVERFDNGTINAGSFLKLKNPVGNSEIGLPDLSTSEDKDFISSSDDYGKEAEETNGMIEKGDAEDEGDSMNPADLTQKPGSASDRVGLWFAIVDKNEISYTGKALKPEIHVYYDNSLLSKKEYSVTYKNNVNAWEGDVQKGTPLSGRDYASDKIPTIIVKGKGNYIGQAKEIYFEIKPVDIGEGKDAQNRVSAPAITLLKAGQTPKPIITFVGKKLSDRKDFASVSTAVRKDSVTGKEYWDVKGTGNFTGERAILVRDASSIAKDHLASSFKVDKIAPQYRKGYEMDYSTGKVKEYLQVRPLTANMVKTSSGGALTLYNPETGTGDIEITYVNNIEVGTATAIITGMNDYYGTKEVKFKIIAPPLAKLLKDGNLEYIDTTKLISKAVEGTTPNYDRTTGKITSINGVKFDFKETYDYAGKAVQLDGLGMAVKTDNEWYRLTNNEDYTISYKGNNKAGSANVVVKGKGNYTGSITQKFKIAAYDISQKPLGGTFALNEDKTAKYFEKAPSGNDYGKMKAPVYYDKSGAKPAISLRVGGSLMRAGKDYTITYRNNMKVGGDATFTIRGKGALTGTITGSYQIVPRPFNDPENRLQITATDVKLSTKDGENGFKGKNNTKIVVKDAKGKSLSLNKDYVIDRYEYVDAVTYAPIGGTIEDNRAEVKIDNKDSFHTVRVTLKGTGENYTDAEMYAYYRITWAKNSIRNAKVEIDYSADSANNPGLAGKYFYYKEGGTVTLNENTLKVTVNEKLLTRNVDYEVVEYIKNDRKGTAKLIIQGKGEYVETKVINFKIGAYTFDWWAKGDNTSSQILLNIMNGSF